jgi:hypothetical protein
VVVRDHRRAWPLRRAAEVFLGARTFRSPVAIRRPR